MFNCEMFAVITTMARKYIFTVCGAFHPYFPRQVDAEAVVYTHKYPLYVLVSLSSIHRVSV